MLVNCKKTPVTPAYSYDDLEQALVTAPKNYFSIPELIFKGVCPTLIGTSGTCLLLSQVSPEYFHLTLGATVYHTTLFIGSVFSLTVNTLINCTK